MSEKTRLRVVIGWVSKLANRTSRPADQGPVTIEARIEQTSLHVADAFHDQRVFCDESLTFVTDRHPFFPSAAELKASLAEWWEENRPTEAPAPGSHALSRFSAPMRIMIETWQRYRAGVPLPGEPTPEIWVSMCRAHANVAYLFLLRSDQVVQAIARERDWRDGSEPALSDEEREAIIAARHQVDEAVRVEPERMVRQPAPALAVAAPVEVEAVSVPPPESAPAAPVAQPTPAPAPIAAVAPPPVEDKGRTSSPGVARPANDPGTARLVSKYRKRGARLPWDVDEEVA